jgi:hypothetical protein
MNYLGTPGFGPPAFLHRLSAVRLLARQLEPTPPIKRTWKTALTGEVDAAPAAATTAMPLQSPPRPVAETRAMAMLGPEASLRTRVLLRSAIADQLSVTLVAQFEGPMRMHEDISHEGILRQLVNVTPTIAKQNQEFKEDLALARYEPAANRALFIFDTMALARKWINHSLPVQGHMLPLRLAHAGHAGGASPLAIVAIDEYEFTVLDTAGNYSAYQLWHLLDRILGLPVVQLLQQTATATGVLDPTRWTVVVKANGCPPQLRGKTRLEHAGRKLWLHHTAFATHPPCSRCAEDTHPTHSCAERQLVQARILQVDCEIPTLSDALAAAAREDPEQFAPWLQDLAKRQRVRRPLAHSCLQAAEESSIVDGITAIRALADASPE